MARTENPRVPTTASVAVALVLVATLAACSSTSQSTDPGALVTPRGGTEAPGTTSEETASTTTGATTTTLPAELTAGSLAAELSAVEAGIRDPDATAAELDEWGRRQQLAYRAVNRHPEWHSALTSSVDEVARVPLAYHLAARQAQVDHAAGKPPTDPVTVLPPWTIVDPLPADELLGYYHEAEAATGVPWEYLAAIHFQETRMGRIVGVSSAGAVGPMQFLPSTWATCCTGDPTVARDAIIGAAVYLVRRGAPGDMQAALDGYNPNAGYVGAVTAYAQNMMADPRAYSGYHGWEVFVGTESGTVRLPVGYSSSVEVPVVDWLRDHPDDLVGNG